MNESAKLFAFFQILDEDRKFFGKDVGMESKDFQQMLEIYNPWEWSEEHQSAPVDYILGLGSNSYSISPKTVEEIWGLLEMCLQHPCAPEPHTWSSRLSCMTQNKNMFNVDKPSIFMREDPRLPWLHALAKGVLNKKITQYAQLGGTLGQTFKGLSPLMFLYQNTHIEDWFVAAAHQKCDLTTGNLGQYFKSWSKLNSANITSLGQFAETVRKVRHKYSPLSEEDKVFEEWLEAIAACNGSKSTSAKAKDPVLVKHLQNETHQKMMLDTVCSIMFNMDQNYGRMQHTEVGALKVVFKMWDTCVPKTSPWQTAWQGMVAYFSGLDSSLSSTLQTTDVLKNLHALNSFLQQTNQGLQDDHWRKILIPYKGDPAEIQFWAWEGTLPVHQPWNELKNITPSKEMSKCVIAMIGNAVRLQSTYLFLKNCSVQLIQDHLDMMDENDVLPKNWCARVLEECESYKVNQRLTGVIDLMESVAAKHNLTRSLQEQHAVLQVAPSRRKM